MPVATDSVRFVFSVSGPPQLSHSAISIFIWLTRDPKANISSFSLAHSSQTPRFPHSSSNHKSDRNSSSTSLSWISPPQCTKFQTTQGKMPNRDGHILAYSSLVRLRLPVILPRCCSMSTAVTLCRAGLHRNSQIEPEFRIRHSGFDLPDFVVGFSHSVRLC